MKQKKKVLSQKQLEMIKFEIYKISMKNMWDASKTEEAEKHLEKFLRTVDISTVEAYLEDVYQRAEEKLKSDMAIMAEDAIMIKKAEEAGNQIFLNRKG